MKIIMVNKFLYPKGGAETYFLKIGNFLKKAGHDIEYFGMYDEKNVVGNSWNLYTKSMDFHRRSIENLLYPFHIIYSLEARKKLRALIQSFEPDLIHFNNINFQLTPSMMDAGAKEGIPMVQTVHDFQMLCPNHMMLDLKQMKPCERCVDGSPFSCIIHSCIHLSKAKSLIGAVENLLYRFRKNYSRIDCYVCPSRFMESMLLKRNIYRGKTEVLHNFIEPIEHIHVEKEEYVLYFGRLSIEKGIDRLMEACKKLPDIKFKFAGSGPLECLLTDSKLPNVEYIGFKGGTELRELIKRAAFSVYLPVWYENCPLSVLESQSMGTPVLANKIGGIPELIEDGVTGMLISDFSADSYVNAIGTLFRDKDRLRSMQENCIKKSSEQISLEQYVTSLMRIYKRCVLEHRKIRKD